ncbi:MAG: hypothetical protein O2829_01460 [Bacteroidetes bacterium]|nr:hypothetical protein [Bacteroidota bacterium]MDA1267745.1 hypothetical protein [Bacteroidota bacterium]
MKFLSSIHFRYAIVSLLVAATILLFGIILPKTIHSAIWNIFGFVAGLSYLLNVITFWLYQKFPENFVSLKILGMLIRFLSALGFIGILIVLGLENIILFLVNFFLIFLFYLIFDIYTFISNLRPNSK